MSHGYAGCREAGRRDAPGLHRGWLLSLPLVPASGSVLAEGTRTLHPAGAPGERDVMDAGNPPRSTRRSGVPSSRWRGSFPQRVLAATAGTRRIQSQEQPDGAMHSAVPGCKA